MKKRLFRRQSKFHRVEVYDDQEDGRRVRRLCLDGVEHSAIALDQRDFPVHVYTEFLYLAWIFNQTPRRFLIAGLGGGTMPMRLHRSHPEISMDVLEIDPVVLLAARKYFGLRPNPQLRITISEVAAYLRQSHDLFDVMMLDVFESRHDRLWTPSALLAAPFLKEVVKHLSPDGVMVFNLVGRLKGRKTGKTLALLKKLQRLFPQVYLFPIFLKKAPDLSDKRNILFVCSKNGKRLSAKSIQQRAKIFSRKNPAISELPSYAENYYGRS